MMNPYDFVRVDWDRPPARRPAPRHDRWEMAALHGSLEGTITALSPVFVRRAEQDSRFDLQGAAAPAQRRLVGGGGQRRQYLLPASSLKGLFRSVFEAVTGSCFLFGAPDELRLPPGFSNCESRGALCPACRVFGFLSGGELSAGLLAISEAATEPTTDLLDNQPYWTLPTRGPQPHHRAFYTGDPNSRRPLGRKFYFHQHFTGKPPQVAQGKFPPNAPLNQQIRPVAAGTVFGFRADFSNVAEDDFRALLYSLTLQSDMAHKIGMGKAMGLGSVRVQLHRAVLRDPSRRYRPGATQQVLEGSALDAYVAQARDAFVAEPPCGRRALTDLRRIWHYPPHEGISFGYPSREWFDDEANTDVTLHELDPNYRKLLTGQP